MQDFWVFGYGSLMWRPGFAFEEQRPALLRGAHRSLCVLSHVHRGTPERPGLVLGLDRGGSCRGTAFRIAPENWRDVRAYLVAREQVTAVYREATRKISFVDRADDAVSALVFLIDRKHPQYSGQLSIAEQVELIVQGCGMSGYCADYVRSTVLHLRELGIHDPELEILLRALDRAEMLAQAR